MRRYGVQMEQFGTMKVDSNLVNQLLRVTGEPDYVSPSDLDMFRQLYHCKAHMCCDDSTGIRYVEIRSFEDKLWRAELLLDINDFLFSCFNYP